MKFAELTAPSIRALDRDGVLVVAPIAACEQHAGHLPTFTDTILVSAVAEGAERELSDRILLLPTLWLGASEHHLSRGGTLTATLETYERMLVDLLAPIVREGFRRLLILNGHGGNTDPLRAALRRLDVLFPRRLLAGAAYWEPARAQLAELCEGPRKTVGHACEIETSMMLHLRPDLVVRTSIEDDPERTPEGLESVFLARDFGVWTDHGAVGHPRFASAEKGERMLAVAVSAAKALALALLQTAIP